jgi:PhzF family phenazine biosynthesis protein
VKEERFQFKKIDAFATEKSEGNPAGMIMLHPSEEITDEKMQQIAKELKGFVSETGFVFPESDEKFRLKYFPPKKKLILRTCDDCHPVRAFFEY